MHACSSVSLPQGTLHQRVQIDTVKHSAAPRQEDATVESANFICGTYMSEVL